MSVRRLALMIIRYERRGGPSYCAFPVCGFGKAAAGVARTGGFGTARFPPRNVPACKPRSRAVS